MNIVVGKIGKKFYFNKKHWTINSGDSEVSSLIITLAAMNPNVNFYIIGINDLSKLPKETKEKYFPHNNVIDIWKDFNGKNKQEYVSNYFKNNNITIDFGYMHVGPVGLVNIPEKSYVLGSKQIAKTICMVENYAGPIVYYLNESNIPWVALGEDPKFFPIKSRDLFNRPKVYLSTYNGELKAKYCPDYLTEEIIETKEKILNVKYDRWFLISEDKNKINDWKKYKKENELDVYTNGNGSAGTKKIKIINEYFKNYKSTVFGKWDDPIIEQNTSQCDFQDIPMSEMNDRLYKTKYTLMFHFAQGFPSSKFWKMIYFGILPIYHNSMDEQKTQPVHDKLRINSEEEFLSLIKELNKNNKLFKEMQEYHSSMFLDEYFDGSFVNNIFRNCVKIYGNKKLQKSIKYNFYKESILHGDDK